MAENPPKRSKRTDSSAMWERDSSRRGNSPAQMNGTSDRSIRREPNDKDEQYGRRDNRKRERSHSHDRRRDGSRDRKRLDRTDCRDKSFSPGPDRRREKVERSHSPNRDRKRHNDGGRDLGRDRRNGDRSRSRDRHRSRRDDPPPSRRSDRPRSRSASPRKDTHLRTRTRTPPRSSRRSRSPPPKHTSSRQPTAPPTGPRSARPPPTGPSTKASPGPPPSKTTTNGTSTTPQPAASAKSDAMDTNEEDLDSDPEVAAMQRAMGFSGFKSTKNKQVKGNNVYGVRKEKKTEYRQYMNRVGGFNRPLSPSR